MSRIFDVIKSNKAIFITILIVIILLAGTIVFQKTYSLEESGEYTTRNLYRNQWFTSDSAMSNTVLSDSATGTSSISLPGGGPGGSLFVGFAGSQNTTVSYADVDAAAKGNSSNLYNVYKFNVNYSKGSNISEIGSTTAFCNAVYPSKTCNVTLPSITANSGYTPVGWNTQSGATSGTPAGNQYAIEENNTTLYANAAGNVYTATFYYQTSSTSGTTNISHVTETCTVESGNSSCSITIPTLVRSSVGTYNNSYIGLANNLNTMTTDITSTTISLTSDKTYYSVYRSNVDIYGPTSTTGASGTTLYRNQYFTSNTSLSDTVLASTSTGTTNGSYSFNVSGYNLYGFGTSLSSNTKTYNNFTEVTQSSSTKIYAILYKQLESTFYYSGDNVGTKVSTTATGNQYIRCTSTSVAEISNGVITPNINNEVAPFGGTINGWYTSAGSMNVASATTQNNTYYRNYSKGVTLYYYGSSYTNTTQYRNSYLETASSTSYKTVLASSNTGTSNYNTSVGPGSSVWTGLSTGKDINPEYATIEAAATSSSNTLYTVYTMNVKYYKGNNVSSIGSETGSCKVTTSNTSCYVTLPEITSNEGFTSVGWNTENGAVTGTEAGSDYGVSENNLALYANAQGNVYSATFYYQSNNTGGTEEISHMTETCTVESGNSSCSISVPSAVTSSVGKYNNSYVGLSDTLNTMNTSVSTNTITLTSNKTYYGVYRSNVNIYGPSSTTAANSTTLYRNQYFTSNNEMSNSVLASTATGKESASYSSGVSGYGLTGFATTTSTNTSSYNSISDLTNSTYTTVYAVLDKEIEATFYYSSNSSGTKKSTTTRENRYIRCTSTTGAEIYNSTYNPNVSDEVAPYSTNVNGWNTSINSMSTTNATTASDTYYRNYTDSVTLYYYNSNYTDKALNRNAYLTTASDTTYKVVLGTSNTATSNYSPAVGPGSSAWTGLSTGKDTSLEYSSVESAATSNSKTLYTIYTMNVSYEKGSNVASIGATSDNCKITTSDENCTVILPNITASTGFTSVGWNTQNGATTGTAAGTSYTLTTNNTKLYANASGNVYTANFYYQTSSEIGTENIAHTTATCTVQSGNSNCNATIPESVKNSVGKYNNSYIGLSTSLSTMSTNINNSETNVTLTDDATYYAVYRSNVNIYGPTSSTAAANKTLYRNQYFTSKTALSDTVLSSTNTGKENASYSSEVSGYDFYGFSKSVSSNISDYNNIASLTKSNTTTVYAILYKQISGTFYYSSDSLGTKTSTTASGNQYVRCTNGTAAEINNGSINPNITDEVAPYSTTINGWNTEVGSMNTREVNTSNTTYYRNYSKNVTLYLYDSSYINTNLNRNSFLDSTSSNTYKTVLSTTSSGTSNYTSKTGPGNSIWTGLSTGQDLDPEYITIEKAAESASTTLYTVYTFNAIYEKGSDVSSIGNSNGSCKVTTDDTSCNITLPTITPNTGFTSVGWSTTKDSATGTKENTSYNLETNNTKLYGNVKGNTYKATFHYQSDSVNGNEIVSQSNVSCTVQSGNSNCSITVPSSVTESVGKYNNSYIGLAKSVNTMTPNVNKNTTSITLTEDQDYYAIYRSAVNIYGPTSLTAASSKTFYRNQYFTSNSAMSNTVLASSETATTNASYTPEVNGYSLEGFSISSGTNDIDYSNIAALAISNKTTAYEVSSKNVTANLYYSGDNTGTKKSSEATAKQYIRCKNNTTAEISNSNLSTILTDEIVPYNTVASGWSSSVNTMNTSDVTTANTSYYRVYSKPVTLYYYGSSYTSTELNRNSFLKESADSKFKTVISPSNVGTSNYNTEKGPGNSLWTGLASSATTTVEYNTVESAATSNTNNLYTIYTFNISYEKGSNVSSIGKASDSCKVTTSDTSCDVTLPSITPNNNFVSVGWNTRTNVKTGTAAGSTYTLENNDTKLYANAKNGVAPVCNITSTNNVSKTQTVTLNCTSTEGVVSYYWGTKSNPTNSDYTTATSTMNLSEQKTVSDSGTYYLRAIDESDNVSTSVSKTFYKTTFNMNYGTVSPEYVITMSSNSFNLPTPTSSAGYEKDGFWYTDEDYTSGAKAYGVSFTPVDNRTLYGTSTKNLNITYSTSDQSKGTVSGNTNEEVIKDNNPRANVTVTPNEGYEHIGWTANKEVTLNNGTNISKGSVISKGNVTRIKVTTDIDLEAIYGDLNYKFGSCYWKVESGVLNIYSPDGNNCTLGVINPDNLPWKDYVNDITSIVIGENVIANENSSWLFSNLPNVTSIDLRNLDTTNAINMSHMFENDINLETILFPDNFVTSNCTDINSMFKNCKSLEELDLKSFNTENVTDMHSLFEGCTNLREVDLSSFDTTNTEDMSRIFYGCENLENIIIDPDKFDLSNVSNIDDMFIGCNKLDSDDLEQFDFSNNDSIQAPSFDDERPEVTVSSDDTGRTTPITPPTGGSGVYTYEIVSGDERFTIRDGEIIIPDDIDVGTYTIVIKVIDELTGKETEVTYVIEIKQGVVPDPNKPTITSDEESPSVYKGKDITFTCSTTSTYTNGTVITYYFGISNSDRTPTSWIRSDSNTYKVSKSNQDLGTKYYACRIKATKNNVDSNYVTSDRISHSITNAKISFDLTNGGKLKGISPLYAKPGFEKLYTEPYETENDESAPSAYKEGYSFNGWFTKVSGGDKVINSKGSILDVEGYTEGGKWILTRHITLYAQYTKNNATNDKPKVTYSGKVETLKTTLTAYRTVNLKWSKVDDATGYRVCYKKVKNDTYKCNNNGSLENVSLKKGTEYRFRITPYKKVNGEYILSSNSITSNIYTLKKMKKPTVEKKNDEKITIKYKKISGVTGYQVLISTKKNKHFIKAKNLSKKKTSYTFKPKKGRVYYYSVRPYKTDNNKKIYAPRSDSVKFKLK